MSLNLTDVLSSVDQLPITEQLKLAAYICQNVSQAVPKSILPQSMPKFSVENYIAQCDAIAEQIEGEFDSAEDMRKIREERMAELG